MTRDQIKECLNIMNRIDTAARGMVYSEGARVIQDLKELTDLICEDLPGHEPAICPNCEELKGIDEMQDCGDERICTDCVARWEKESAA